MQSPKHTADRAIAVVGVGAILPGAPSARAFWTNVEQGRYSIGDVPPDRWDPELYYDPDPKAPGKSYSRIGGWVLDWEWEPLKWRLPIPPMVSAAMDDGQKWAVACTREALLDYGHPERPLDAERTAVILGNAMAGEQHYLTTLGLSFPAYAADLAASPSFAKLPPEQRAVILEEMRQRVAAQYPPVTEDSMPGELANCIAGRVANLFNFKGPNYICDAACASALAAMSAAVEGLVERDFDAVITGGIDRNMGASTFIKFSKIGALSATGTRPYADGADGFVMGEGAAVFILKRLDDAERDGDEVYAVIRGIGGSSDGRGKGITAPNPVGQQLAVRRAWDNAGLSPATAGLIEGHGTSTRVGDVVEVDAIGQVLAEAGATPGSIPLGSVKSNIGHLKAAAGAAGMLKAVFALHQKVLPPSLNFDRPNPNIDFANSPLRVNADLRPWESNGEPRRAGVSAFGFGGTNFHVVLEEHRPGALRAERPVQVAVPAAVTPGTAAMPAPLRGAVVLGADSVDGLREKLRALLADAEQGRAPSPAAPQPADLAAAQRLAIDFADAADLATKAGRAQKALAADNPAMWKALRAQGVFRGAGKPGKVAFLFTGQGSQYPNMTRELCAVSDIARATFAEADAVMTPLLGRPLTELIFVGEDPASIENAENELRQTAVTQPAVLAVDAALTHMLAAYGVEPDMVMGHSLGEYGALVAADALPFAHALEAVSARGREMTNVALDDNGAMAAVFAPIEEIERIVAEVDGYVVIANINSHHQCVIGGATDAVGRAVTAFEKAGFTAIPLPVSHAFHTTIVAPASGPLRQTLERLDLRPPRIPVIANVDGQPYPTGPDARVKMLDILARQVASPVQFIQGLETLYASGVRVFVEVGPKKALQGFVDDVFEKNTDVVSLFTNHPKLGDVASFNQALCGLWAAGVGARPRPAAAAPIGAPGASALPPAPSVPAAVAAAPAIPADRYGELGRLVAEFLERSWGLARGAGADVTPREPVVITGAALGLPGTPKVFDDLNVSRILHGENFIDLIPTRFRNAMLHKHVTRLVKSEDGGPTFETIDSAGDVIKLAARAREFDLEQEFGIAADRIAALDRVTQLAIGAGLDALRDAGIPLVRHYRRTHKGTLLPDRWGLAGPMRDDTGIIFASVFPGFDSFSLDLARFHADKGHHEELQRLRDLRERFRSEIDASAGEGRDTLLAEIDRLIHDRENEIAADPYTFDRRFLFRVLAMGHSQFAEVIGARGPNTQINSACASSTQAVSLAEDWIRAGRCRRVIIVAGDDVTSDNLLEWVGAGFLSTGAAATDDVVEDAALPFDRRRHGTILGMGAAAIVVESADAARERGIRPICEVLATETANSAFHGTRLDVEHICGVMEKLVAKAERLWGISRAQIAHHTAFVSHETFTPARGGSAAAEVHALRQVFGDQADRIVVANTKGFTGHPMGVGIEDVVAIKMLETGIVPPVANYREVDADLGPLNLSKGGAYPVEYALRLGAGFGSQVSMSLVRWVPTPDRHRPNPDELGFATRVADPARMQSWLASLTEMPANELEVVNRTLRIRDTSAGARPAVAQPAPAAEAAPPAPVERAPAAAKPEPTAPPPPAPEPAAPAAAPAVDPVAEAVLQLVAEKTGYPRDMLDIELDLEADLGIDTVKQAEMFAAVREAYDIPREETLKLRDFPTLGHVIGFVRDRRPDLAVAPAPAPVSAPAEPAAPAATPAEAPGEDPVAERVLGLIAEKTGYPRDMLDLDLDLEADLGIDTVKQAEMFAAVREAYDIPREESLKLRDFPTLGHVIGFVRDRRPDLAAPAPQAAPPAAAAEAEPAAGGGDEVEERVLGLIAQKTGYPRDMLDLDLDLEADLGIDTVKQAEMFAAVREAYDIPREETLKLRDFPTLGHVIGFVRDRRPDLAAPAPQAAPPAAAPETEPAAAGGDEVEERVLGLIAQKTGYPRDMLDLDLDLEADLGIDTVKQAEMFAAVREAYDIPREETLKLRDFPTLGHVIGFVRDRRPDLAAGASPAPASTQAAVAEPASEPIAPRQREVGDADAVPRRVPVPVLRPNLDSCTATGVTLASGVRVVVMPDDAGVADALCEQLASRGAEALVLDGVDAPEVLEERLESWLAQGPIHGVYWLPALSGEPDWQSLDLDGWRAALQRRVKLLYRTMRRLYETVATPETFLVSATRLGGRHGYDEAGAVAPMGGAVTGFTKSYKRERAEALVKAVDFAADAEPGDIAATLVGETLTDASIVEVGHCDGRRWSVGLLERPAADGGAGMELGRDTVFVVTGAAGSITSAITADLANASGGTFYLLDLVDEPRRDDPDLEKFSSDKEGLKRELFERIKQSGERATPALVEKELAKIERRHAALSAIRAVEDAGGTAYYFSGDLRDPAAIGAAIEAVRERNGRIDVLLHAGGLEISRFLPDKKPEEYDLVFDVKCDGWFNLMRAIGDMPLGATVAFSSIAGRFGNGGQTDYSAANDLLCKAASNLRTTRPNTRGIVIDWTAWGEIGMASRGSIPKMMEMAGIDMLPPDAGIVVIRRELTAGATRGEIVVADRLGILVAEWDPVGGLAVDAAAANGGGPVSGRIVGMPLHTGLVIETELDPKEQPFLFDHRIEGTPVLPGVMGLEAFAEAAAVAAPGMRVEAFEDVQFAAPFKFYRDEPRAFEVRFRPRAEDGRIVADCELVGRRTLPGQETPQITSHFRARLVLAAGEPVAEPVEAIGERPEQVVAADDVYQLFFHGPAYRVVEAVWPEGDGAAAAMATDLPPNHRPEDAPLRAAPRVVELCFQVAGLFEMGTAGTMGLPMAIERLRYADGDGSAPPLRVRVRASAPGVYDAIVADASGKAVLRLEGYRTVALGEPAESDALARLKGLFGGGR